MMDRSILEIEKGMPWLVEDSLSAFFIGIKTRVRKSRTHVCNYLSQVGFIKAFTLSRM